MGLVWSKQRNVLAQLQQSTPCNTYALITGATSGIGRDLAHELCKRGFNVIAHGRDSKRLETLVDELREQYPSCEIRTFVADAATAFDSSGEATEEMQNALASLIGLNIKVLVNNVGIGHNPVTDFITFSEQTPTQIAQLIHVNISFMTLLTHALLPTLQRTATKEEASVIINAGSLAELGLPWVSVYSGAKAYITGFSKALDTELRGESQSVKVVSSLIGDTDSDGHRVGTSLFTPSSKDMARMILNSATTGGGVSRVPYWGHWLQLWLCKLQPYRLLQAGMIYNVSELREKNKASLKKQN